jgi:hypothetical protein
MMHFDLEKSISTAIATTDLVSPTIPVSCQMIQIHLALYAVSGVVQAEDLHEHSAWEESWKSGEWRVGDTLATLLEPVHRETVPSATGMAR